MQKNYIILVVILVAVLILPYVVMDSIYPVSYSEYVERYSEEYELDLALVYAVIKVESNFDKDAVSRVGARGLMQIMPTTAIDIAHRIGDEYIEGKLFEPETNIRYGCFYLRYLLDMFREESSAIASFNAGLSNVRSWLQVKEYSKDGIALDRIPFKETREYLDKIRMARFIYTQKV